MKKLTTLMMSMVVILMLGCSALGLYGAQSSRLHKIDIEVSTCNSTSLLTDTLTNYAKSSTINEISQAYSRLFATTLDYVSRNSKASCTDKKIIATEICKIALENDIDICFILAQGTIETQIGSLGIGRTRHSIFGVYKTYKDYRDCIQSYAKILKKSYLTRGRTEKDLMRKYTTTGGSRYAADGNYEKKLTKAYYDILKSHNELKATQETLKSYNYAGENQKLDYQDPSLANLHRSVRSNSQDLQ